MAGGNQNAMRLVLIELIDCWRHRIQASPLCATVDDSERNSPRSNVPNPSFFATSLSAYAVIVCAVLAILEGAKQPNMNDLTDLTHRS
jgi:hypothetical protein